MTQVAQGRNVAVIDVLPPTGQNWCNLLIQNGHTCTLFPKEGPTGPLDPFDVVIDLSSDWTDPTGMLIDCMHAGKTVITAYSAPQALGIDTNPSVQAWIGANSSPGGSARLRTTASDPILGGIPPGTVIMDCADSICSALQDTSGHPGAKTLAVFADTPTQPIGILRNDWEGGLSIFLGDYGGILLNAVAARPLVIPTLGAWGLLAMTLGILIAGTIIIRRVRFNHISQNALSVLLVLFLSGSVAAQANVNSTTANGITYLRLDDSEPFHSTDNSVGNLRSVAIPHSAGVAVLWEETDDNELREPYYAISLDGSNVDEVRATSYDLQLRYARFDPGDTEPAVHSALVGQTDGEHRADADVDQPRPGPEFLHWRIVSVPEVPVNSRRYYPAVQAERSIRMPSEMPAATSWLSCFGSRLAIK